MTYLGLINQYYCIWYYHNYLFLKKEAMHKKNICNNVHILNTKDVIEARSSLENRTTVVIWNMNLLCFKPYAMWGLIKKSVGSSCFYIWCWAWNHHRVADLTVGKKRWVWSGAEQGQIGTCVAPLSAPTSGTWENYRMSWHYSLKSCSCACPEAGDEALVGDEGPQPDCHLTSPRWAERSAYSICWTTLSFRA